MTAASELQTTSLAISETERVALFEKLYDTVFERVARFVHSMGGGLEDAQDIFQDALIIYYEKLEQGGTQQVMSSEAYLLGISKHLWLRKFRKDIATIHLDELERQIEIPEAEHIGIDTNRLLRVLQRSGEQCMRLLAAFYFDNISPTMLAKRFGFANKRSATAQKYKCLEKVRSFVKERSITYEEMLD